MFTYESYITFAKYALTFCAGAVVALLLAPEAHGQEYTAHKYCNHLANYAEAVAKDRDNGASMHSAMEIAVQEEIPRLRSDYALLVQLAHLNPDYSTGKVAGVAFVVCWGAYGGDTL